MVSLPELFKSFLRIVLESNVLTKQNTLKIYRDEIG